MAPEASLEIIEVRQRLTGSAYACRCDFVNVRIVSGVSIGSSLQRSQRGSVGLFDKSGRARP
jgi:hypothetical protein